VFEFKLLKKIFFVNFKKLITFLSLSPVLS